MPAESTFQFQRPGHLQSTGITSHPNSTFIPVVQVPEDLTTVTVAGQQAGGWINNSTATVTLSSQPPVLVGTTRSRCGQFCRGADSKHHVRHFGAKQRAAPSAPASTDTMVQNNISCPQPSNPLDPPATVFATTPQTISNSRTAIICSTITPRIVRERRAAVRQDSGGNWSTSYYTFPSM